MKLYQAIANEINRIELNQNNTNDALEQLISYLPSGSGFDGQIFIEYPENKTPNNGWYFNDKYTLLVPYHCMNDNGYYDGWIEVLYTITPSFDGFNIKENWRGYRGRYKEILKDYMVETISYYLDLEMVNTWNMGEKRNYYQFA